jgi:hypothetical protein
LKFEANALHGFWDKAEIDIAIGFSGRMHNRQHWHSRLVSIPFDGLKYSARNSFDI